MKKLFIFLAILSIGAIGFAQDFSMNARSTYATYTGTSTDVVDTIESLSKVLDVNKGYLYYYDIIIDIDTNGTDNATIVFAGSNDNVNYTTINSITYAASADTIIRLSNLSGTTQTIASYTITSNLADTVSTYNMITDTTGLSGYPADTISVGQVTSTTEGTQTVASQTITFNEGGVMWNYLKFTITGVHADTDLELQAIRVKVVEIP